MIDGDIQQESRSYKEDRRTCPWNIQRNFNSVHASRHCKNADMLSSVISVAREVGDSDLQLENNGKLVKYIVNAHR